ncbi:M28 family peptidase [Brevibacillus sp. NRS-1366]|uniref:M28 family peptidase n=1 Tax=Brevibacillus sp. NRS-1366 TaxID=3233899 RepID=UPI003D1A918F
MTSLVKVHEKLLLDEISMEIPKRILDTFSGLIRESGSEDESTAAHFLASLLKEWGVPHTVHYPSIYLSVPKKASVKTLTSETKWFRAKTSSFSVSTNGVPVTGELVYVPSAQAMDRYDIFDAKVKEEVNDLSGKIVISEGLAMPEKVATFHDKGVLGAIFINPGKNIHDGICTTIWGSPDLDTIDDEPKIPVVAINKLDGEELKSMCQTGKTVIELSTSLEKGWFDCPLIDLFIEGTEEPEKYILLHGHLDSWHVGIGDNTTGDAALMEMARICYKHRDKLKRSLRIAIWPGHSTGRYAGSTWFADRFALDLDANCIAQVNCDSPGCRQATSYEKMDWTNEVEDHCKQSIFDAVQEYAKGKRPNRAGDYSFHNIGITSFYKLSSSIPQEQLKEKGYYPVGGCGSNIEWHTEDDLMHVADYEILHRDLKVYMTSIYRVLQATLLLYDFRKTADEFMETIQQYQEAAGEHFSFQQAANEVKDLRRSLEGFYMKLQSLHMKDLSTPAVREVNEKLLQLSRTLIPINFTRRGKFHHDPAVQIPALPDIAPALQLAALEPGSHRYRVTQNHLLRGQNRVIWAMKEAQKLINLL